MRKESRNRNVNFGSRSVDSYHGGIWSGESYAFAGFESNLYFTSDRKIKLDDHWNRADGQPLNGYGLEIEIECWSINSSNALAKVLKDLIFPTIDRELIKLQSDGSLDGGESQAECITQVMTKEFIRNHYPEWKAIFNSAFTTFGISATRSGNCGMHVNLSNALFGRDIARQTEAIRKFCYIINKHYKVMARMVNRDLWHTTYCDKMSGYDSKSFCQSLDLNSMYGNHYMCINGSHYSSGRMELRVVGGQKDFACFRNTMETIFHIVDRCKTISWNDCDDLFKIFRGCNQYVLSRLKRTYEEGYVNYDLYSRVADTIKAEDLI